MTLETKQNVSRKMEQSAVLNSNEKLNKIKRDKMSIGFSIMTLTGAISIMCEARRKPGWSMLRRKCEMRKCRQCPQFAKVKKKWIRGQRE